MDISKAIQSAFLQYQTGNLREVKHICAAILKEDPDNGEILYLLGVAHAELEEYDPAIQYLERSLQFNRGNADAYLALGAISQKRGLCDIALDFYRKATETDPAFAEAYENMGDLFRASGRLDEAITFYKKALQYSIEPAEIHLNLGNIFSEKKQPDLAVFYYRKALHHKSDYAEAYQNLGMIFHTQGRLEEAITHYKKALQYNPKLCEACINLSHASQEKRRRDEALRSKLRRMLSDVGLGFLRVEMMINAVINEFYLRTLNVQYHPGVLDERTDAPGLKRKILERIFSHIGEIDNSDKFFRDLDRLDTIRKYCEKYRPDTSTERDGIGSAQAFQNDGAALIARLHSEFMSTAGTIESRLAKILNSEF